MIDADHNGWETFCEQILYHLTVDKGPVRLVLTNYENTIKIEIDENVLYEYVVDSVTKIQI